MKPAAAAAVGIADFDATLPFHVQFERFFAPRLAHRAAGFRAIFERLDRVSNPVIVETGCLRDIGNWTGDGQSSFMFDRYAAARGGEAWAVDVSHGAVAAARSVTRDYVIPHVYLGDSVRFLASFHTAIDLLYLDSLDFDGNRPLISATHHLFEMCAAGHRLKAAAIVAVDDMGQRDGKPFGKGMLVADYMKRIGAKLFLDDYQMAWAMPER